MLAELHYSITELTMDTSEDFVDQAERLLGAGRASEAEDVLSANLSNMPADWQWLVDRGSEREIAFWDESELRAYVAFFGARLANGLRVTWVGPSYPKGLRIAAELAAAGGRPDEAQSLLEQAIELEPDQPKLLLALAKLRETTGRPQEALALADRAATARAWAPAGDAALARDVATRVRIRLSSAPTADERRVAAEPLRSAPAPSLSLLDETSAPREGFGRLLGGFESVTAKLAAIVAGVTAVVLLVAGALAIFRTPPDVARAQRFGAEPSTYVALLDAPPAPSTPYRRGKVAVVDVDTKALDPIFHQLDPSVRAENPSEVGTVVLLKWVPQTVTNYYTRDGRFLERADITTCEMTAVDVRSRLAVSRRIFSGEDPADHRYRVPNDRSGAFGTKPNGAVIDFVESLPILAVDAPAVVVAGSDPNPGRAVAPGDLYDVHFTVATAPEKGPASKSPGLARGFKETLPGGASFEMLDLPGGTYPMGVASVEPYQTDFGEPRHDVSVRGFYIGRAEVTAELWRAVAALPKINREIDPNPSHLDGAALPASAISFADANEFCLRLARATGRAYRLPTEAEWEYAALGGSDGPYPTGAGIDPNVANVSVDPDDEDSPKGPVRTGPTAVGSFGVANRFGLFDVDGNVAEWCADAFHPSYLGAPRDGSAWLLGSQDMRRVLRGGAFATLWTEANAHKRYGFEPTVRYGFFGLRLALSKG